MLSRAELRDIVDVMHLERLGCPLEDALDLGHQKDGGLSAGQLAWVLSEFRIGDDARLPNGSTPDVVREYVAELCGRLTALAHPRA